jgi:transcriptional regulator with PAS, ATPase and Fis domain
VRIKKSVPAGPQVVKEDRSGIRIVEMDGCWKTELVGHFPHGAPTCTLVGTREGLEEVLRPLRLVAPCDARVLITGETGTGKNTVAEIIHHMHQERRQHHFRRTNLGALVPELAASQLFGHVKGAFTGAVKDSPGIVVESNRGTLFLDQLSDASSAVQTMLLTLLEVKKVNPVGAHGVPGKDVDFRVIAGTIESPEELRESGKVREDLFYRINEYHIELKPLRFRRSEILPMARFFLDQARELRKGMAVLTLIAPDAQRALEAYHWPGNVRELDHAIRGAVVESRADPTATVLEAQWFRIAPRRSRRTPSDDYETALHRFRHEWAHRLLASKLNNKDAAATMGISQDTFRKYRDWNEPGAGERPRDKMR